MSRRSPLVLTACAALVLAACGGDGDAPAATGPTAPAPTAPATSGGTNNGTNSGTVTTNDAATTDSAATTNDTTTNDTTTPAAEAPEALRFTAPLVGGGELDAAALAGQPVLFWFWAPF